MISLAVHSGIDLDPMIVPAQTLRPGKLTSKLWPITHRGFPLSMGVNGPYLEANIPQD